jgi:hypothetical protein
MQTYYVLDLGIYGPEDWADCKVATEASSARDAAQQRAAEWDEDGDDGRRIDVAVSEEADGSNAEVYQMRCEVTVTYEVKKTTPFKVELPEEDE